MDALKFHLDVFLSGDGATGGESLARYDQHPRSKKMRAQKLLRPAAPDAVFLVQDAGSLTTVACSV